DVVEGVRLVVSGVPASKVSALYNTKDGQRLLMQSFSANGDAQAVLWVPKAASPALAVQLRELAPGKIVVIEEEEDEEDGTWMDGDAEDSLEAERTDADVATDTMSAENHEEQEEEDEEGIQEEEEEAEEEMHQEAESEEEQEEAVLPIE
ncbi:unnamed protein product, partial [Symbiodinium sp. CCMP2456]